jgi:hypothetical protein
VHVEKVIRGQGAYKYLISTLGEAGKKLGNFILYRGTRALPSCTDWWKTLVEDFRFRIGSKGSEATFEETKSHLQRASFQGKKLTLIGNSLGGVHAQHDACLHAAYKVITVASPGIDKKTAQKFAEGPKGVVEIEHYIEDLDIMDQFGEALLGAFADPEKVRVAFHILSRSRVAAQTVHDAVKKVECSRLQLSKPVADVLKKSNQYGHLLSFGKIASNLIRTILYVHTRNVMQGPHTSIDMNSTQHKELLQALLAHESLLFDPNWERLRSLVPLALSKL